MRRLQIVTVIVVASCSPMTAMANGLLYKLPPDGSRVVYDMTMVNKERNMTINGTLSMSSVGTATVEGKKCRWIEFSMRMSTQGRERTVTAKLLIPEANIGTGKNPGKNIKKGWIKLQDETKEFTDLSDRRLAGPIPAFLPGPLTGRKELKAASVKTGLGKLTCQGETGSITYKQGTTETKVDYETRLNDKSPFGVAITKLTILETRNGQKRGAYEINFKLKSVSKNAKSALPDKN